jgi:hypothetical protein
MPTLSPRTLCFCVKLSSLRPQSCGLSAVDCELSFSLSPLFATLTSHTQLAENKATLSPFPATLTSCVNPKSFVCNSYEKHRGWREGGNHAFTRYSPHAASATHRNARISNPLTGLLHNSLDTRGVAVCRPSPPPISLLPPSTFNFQLSTSSANHGAAVTEHGSRTTSP